MAPHLNTSLQNKSKINNNDTTTTSKELQWEDDPNDKVWVTSSKDISETSNTPLNMPLLDDTQIIYTTQKQEHEFKKVNRLSMDADLFKSTIKNFENLSGTKPKVSQKNTISNQSKYQENTHTSQENQQKTQFNLGQAKKYPPNQKPL